MGHTTVTTPDPDNGPLPQVDTSTAPPTTEQVQQPSTIPATSMGVDPSLVPDKYKRPDGSVDFAAILTRHQQLEQMLGQRAQAAPETAPPSGQNTQTPEQNAPLSDEELTPFVHEYANTGHLSEASYRLLESRGYTRELVQSLVAGKQAQLKQYYDAIEQAAGGAEEYRRIAAWAETNLPPAEASWYSGQIHSGDPAAATAAVAALKARADQDMDQGILEGDRLGTMPGVVPFKSEEEVYAAMRVPSDTEPGKTKYETDPVYRKQVIDRHVAFRAAQARRQR